MTIRWAKNEDISALSQLWLACFGDDETFRSWFFQNRFWPEYCLTACEDGRPVGAVYGLPTRLWVRQKAVPAVIIGGVSTHPKYRGKGIMHRLFADFMADMHRRGIPLTFLHPVREDLYFSLEHYTCSDRGILTLSSNAARPPLPDNVVPLSHDRHIRELCRCYQQYIAPYSGPVWRQEKDFLFKACDYKAGGAKLAALFDPSGQIEGYCYYFADDSSVMGEEVVALTPGAWQQLTHYLAHQSLGLELTVKLPHDRMPVLPHAIAETKPWGCMGVGHLPTLLQRLGGGHSGFAIEVTDPVVAANNGVFDLLGQPTNLAPQLSLSAGRLMQWLSGYRSLIGLADQGHAVVHNAAAVARLDELLPPQNCLCSEEY